MRKKEVFVLILGLITLLLSGCSCRHKWQEATCTEPKTCSKCGETEGEALGHTPGDWIVGESDFVAAEKQENLSCSVCGEVLETRSESLTVLYHDGKFDFNVEEFSDRLSDQLDEVRELLNIKRYQTQYASGAVTGAVCTVTEMSNAKEIADIRFAEGIYSFAYETDVLKDSKGHFASFGCTFSTRDADVVTSTMLGIMMTCDPTLSCKGALYVCMDLSENSYAEHNGICFYLREVDGNYMLGVMAEGAE